MSHTCASAPLFVLFPSFQGSLNLPLCLVLGLLTPDTIPQTLVLGVLSSSWSTCRLCLSTSSWGGGVIDTHGFTSLLLPLPPFLSSLSPECLEPTELFHRHPFYQVQNWTWLNFSASYLNSILFPFPHSVTHVPPSIFHTSVIGPTRYPGATSTLLSTPPYFSTKSSGGADNPKVKSMFSECRWIGGLLAFRHSCAPAGLQEEKGAFRQTDLCDFQEPNQEKEEGLFPCPAPDWPRLLHWAAAGRNGDSCLPLASVSHKKTTPTTSGSWTQISAGHIPVSNTFLEPDLQTWESEALHEPSLAQTPFSRRAPAGVGPHPQIPLVRGHQQGSQSRRLQRLWGSASTCKTAGVPGGGFY